MLTHNDLEKIGEKEVRHSLLCGDYCEPSEIALIESWLREQDKERDFDATCELANKSAALDSRNFASLASERADRAEERAKRAEIMATIAVITAIISCITSIFTFINK